MKAFISLLFFQFLIYSVYAQGADSSPNINLQQLLEQQLFPGSPLPENYHFSFPGTFSELKIKTTDSIQLSGLLFKAKQSKGLIFYLHGSNNALNTWGEIAPVYTSLHYDLFMLDYRGYGKSGGKVTGETQLYIDLQTTYDRLKLSYPESKIVLLGQSIGTGPAAMLASTNHPKKLILQAPYYSLADWIRHVVPDIDTSSFTHHFPTYTFLQKTRARVIVFHGDADDAIYYGSSKKLSRFFKPGDTLIRLEGEGHNDLTNNQVYLNKLKVILQ